MTCVCGTQRNSICESSVIFPVLEAPLVTKFVKKLHALAVQGIYIRHVGVTIFNGADEDVLQKDTEILQSY